MPRIRKAVVVACACAMIALLLFPPWWYSLELKGITLASDSVHAFLGTGPSERQWARLRAQANWPQVRCFRTARIDWERLVSWLTILVVATGILLVVIPPDSGRWLGVMWRKIGDDMYAATTGQSPTGRP